MLIECDLNYIRKKYFKLKGDLFNREDEDFKTLKQWNGNLELRYCHEREVTKRNRIFLNFEACFLLKIKNLQLDGYGYALENRFTKWIDEHI